MNPHVEDTRLRVAAYALVRADASILLTRIPPHGQVFTPGTWHLPGGGLLPGEQPADALKRELFEETGRAVDTAKLLDAGVYQIPHGTFAWNIMALIYDVELRPAEPAPPRGSHQGVEYSWIDLQAAATYDLTPVTRDALRLLERGMDMRESAAFPQPLPPA